MNCWQVLEISEQSGSGAVKKAYAAKLKTTKPDEDPEGFKLLHAAYKEALRVARYTSQFSGGDEPIHSHAETEQIANKTTNQPIVLEEPTTTGDDVEVQDGESGEETIAEEEINSFILTKDYLQVNPSESENVEQTSQEVTYSDELSESDEYDFPEDDYEGIENEAIRLLNDKDLINNIEAWKELLSSDLFFDISFKKDFSYFLFEKIEPYLEKSTERPKLNRDVLKILDSFFYWGEQLERLEYDFDIDIIEKYKFELKSPYEKFKSIYIQPKKHLGTIEYPGYFHRVGACILDILIIGGLAKAISFISVLVSPELLDASSIELGFLMWILFFPVMEATPFQATPGKMICGLKVMGRGGKRMNIVHSFIRSIIFGFTLAGFKITIWINMFTFDGRLMHDKISFSEVVKRV